MRSCTFLVCLLFPFSLLAQYFNPLPGAPPSNGNLLSVGDHTILIHPLNENGQSQKWLTYDSTLAIISTKKLVTPHAASLVNQTYLESNNSVFRIDQFIVDGKLQISAFKFDVNGNLINSKPIETKQSQQSKLRVTPFYVSQSADKNSFALVQTVGLPNDSLFISAVALNSDLSIVNRVASEIAFNSLLFDLHLPIVGNNQEIIIATADKFNSYKLSGLLNLYAFHKGDNKQTIKLQFDRKKIKGPQFFMPGNTLFITALFSEKTNKDNVAGVLYTGYDFEKQQQIQAEEFVYGNEVLHQLKKTFRSEGHKGSLLNYVSLLPSPKQKQDYAVLLPAYENPKPMASPKTVNYPKDDLREVKLQQDRVAALVGSQPADYTAPLNVAEAIAVQAINNNPSYVPPNQYQGWSPKGQATRNVLKPPYRKNLLYLSSNQRNSKFIKFNVVDDPLRKFFVYVPLQDGYTTLHYEVPNFKNAYLKSTMIKKDGTLTDKRIFEDKTRVLLSHYPHIVTNDNLVAFYQDVNTLEMGLVKITL